jgi:hypothetical protein
MERDHLDLRTYNYGISYLDTCRKHSPVRVPVISQFIAIVANSLEVRGGKWHAKTLARCFPSKISMYCDWPPPNTHIPIRTDRKSHDKFEFSPFPFSFQAIAMKTCSNPNSKVIPY